MEYLGARRPARFVLLLIALLAGASLCAAFPSGALAARPLARGFADDVWFTGSPSANAQWVKATQATGANRAIFEVDWVGVEPTAPPANVDPTNPNGPEYDFGWLDARVREFAGTGIQPVFLVTNAPQWAQAPGVPASLEGDGAWQPNPTAFGQLAAALARRYSGTFPDPLNPGRTLPRVRYFQAWAEPNLSVHLAPQWTSVGGKLVATGPAIYRSLLNAFYSGVKSVNSGDTVLTGGFGPYGDPASASSTVRMAPALFVRNLLCLNGRSALKPMPCSNPAHFDVMAMDPYEVGSPTTKALNPDDVSAPDLSKLTKPMNKAVRVGRALPRGHKQLWATEFSYDSNPPNPQGVPIQKQARWLEESFYLFWKQGASAVFWYLVRDQGLPNSGFFSYSGVYFNNGQKKPAFEAYRFPFVVWPSGRKEAVWGISPHGGKVAIQRQRGRKWKTMFKLRAGAGGVFTKNISSSIHGNFRAVVGGETSLTWHR